MNPPITLLRYVLVLAIGALSACATTGGVTANSLSAGDEFQECSHCPVMVVVPAGSFVMGSPETEQYRDPDETQHTVTFAKPFAVGKFTVMWDQWQACSRDKWCEGRDMEVALRSDLQGKWIQNYVDHGRGNRPVVGVSWWDAQDFVGWLNHKTGSNNYRLITEAEFEYAARAGTTTAYPWGDKPDHNYANFGKAEGEGLGGKAEGRDVWVDQTSPAGSFPANDFGLHDMHGNVFQWVEDCYEKDATQLPADGSAVTTGNCAVRVMRSNSFTSNPHTLRSANRAGQYPPTLRGRNYLSIRVAKTL